MDIRQTFQSKYLRAADIAARPGGIARVTIKAIRSEEMKNRQGGEESKPVIYFNQAKKGCVLNRTNANKIAEAYGWDTDMWAGHVVELYVAEVEAFGEQTDAIRIRIPRVQPAAPVGASQPLKRHTETMQEPDGLVGEAFDEQPEPGDLDGDANPL